jgi:hypothetical protein
LLRWGVLRAHLQADRFGDDEVPLLIWLFAGQSLWCQLFICSFRSNGRCWLTSCVCLDSDFRV